MDHPTPPLLTHGSHPHNAQEPPPPRPEADSCTLLPPSTNTSCLINPSPPQSSPPPAAPSSTGKTLAPSNEPAPAPSIPPPPSPTLSNTHLSVTNLQRGPETASLYGARTASILSRHSSRSASLQHVGATAAALLHNAEARRLRVNLYRELVGGWFHLSTSSKVLLAYYIAATMVESRARAKSDINSAPASDAVVSLKEGGFLGATQHYCLGRTCIRLRGTYSRSYGRDHRHGFLKSTGRRCEREGIVRLDS
ncbi:hypothetical protein BGZ70_003602 [Mortierella alpina]|uniref:Uncharacterized protein n=1 Tax=Mortierella alpina TaxID=64518 RepID=A0A9P6JEF1_MORAP|nr:hypothetical protein BGZ70_003602 [Mortierella alpina]